MQLTGLLTKSDYDKIANLLCYSEDVQAFLNAAEKEHTVINVNFYSHLLKALRRRWNHAMRRTDELCQIIPGMEWEEAREISGINYVELLIERVSERRIDFVLKRAEKGEKHTEQPTTRRQSKKPETLTDILLNPDDEQFVNDALKAVGIVDAAGKSALGSQPGKLLGFIHAFKENHILKNVGDVLMAKVFQIHIGEEVRRLRKESYVYDKAKNDTKTYLKEKNRTFPAI